MKIENNLILGGYYSDVISNLQGTAIGFVVYLTGSEQVLIQPNIDAQARAQPPVWLDSARLELYGYARPVCLPDEINNPANPDKPNDSPVVLAVI